MIEKTYTTELGFEELFRMHYKMLCNAANTILNDKDASEDMVQDVFLNFWKKKELLPIIQSVKSYLYRSTINASLNQLEKNKKTIRFSDTKLAESLVVNAGENFNHKELQTKIEEAINQLPPKCKVIFVLSRYEGLKYQQIADYLGISIKTVENQMGKALQMLRIRLKPFLTNEIISITITIGMSILLNCLSVIFLMIIQH